MENEGTIKLGVVRTGNLACKTSVKYALFSLLQNLVGMTFKECFTVARTYLHLNKLSFRLLEPEMSRDISTSYFRI